MHGEHRPEDLLAREPHRRLDGAEDRRLDEVAVVRGPRAAGDQVGAVLARGGDAGLDVVAVRLERDRAHLGRGIQRVAEPDRPRPLRQPRHELVVHGGLARAAASPPCRSGRSPRRRRPRRRSAAASRSASANTMCGDLPPSSSDTRARCDAALFMTAMPVARRARERHLVDARMRDQRRARVLPEAGDHVEDARREAGLLDQLGELERRGRRLLGRLDHHRAAGRQRRRQLPAHQQHRRVPRRDRGDHADRLAQRVDRGRRAGRPGSSRRRSCRPPPRSSGSSRPARAAGPPSRGSACRCRCSRPRRSAPRSRRSARPAGASAAPARYRSCGPSPRTRRAPRAPPRRRPRARARGTVAHGRPVNGSTVSNVSPERARRPTRRRSASGSPWTERRHARARLRGQSSSSAPSRGAVARVNNLHDAWNPLYCLKSRDRGTCMNSNSWLAIDVGTAPMVRAQELRFAWERFVDGRATTRRIPQLVREAIADSWRRSSAAGVDPTGDRLAPVVADEEETHDRWEEHPLGRRRAADPRVPVRDRRRGRLPDRGQRRRRRPAHASRAARRSACAPPRT